MLYSLGEKTPNIAADAFVAPTADIIGDVRIASKASVWFQCVLRGDGHYIEVGEGSNIQDNSVLHIRTERKPTIIGKHVTVGHHAVIHACDVEDYGFIGMSASVLDDAVVRSFGFVAAGALIPPGFEVPEKTLVAGVPAKVIRPLRDSEIEMIKKTASGYVQNGQQFLQELAVLNRSDA